jgi:hypothetical protein
MMQYNMLQRGQKDMVWMKDRTWKSIKQLGLPNSALPQPSGPSIDMPLMQLSALMIHFWILPINLERPQEDKLPWNSATWCNATDVHSGLFPDDVSDLPRYIGWDTAQKNAVLRLFNSALNKNAQAVWDLMAHPPADLKGAVKTWNATWKKMWDRVRGFMAIENVLIKTDFHPHSIMMEEGMATCPPRPPSLGTCPQDVADVLFGTAISLRTSSQNVQILTSPVLAIMDQLLSVAWHRLTVKSKRMEKVLERLEKQAVERFESMSSNAHMNYKVSLSSLASASQNSNASLKMLRQNSLFP